MQAADETDRHLAGLGLGVQPIVERAGVLGNVLGLDRRVLENDVAHLGLLFEGPELVREEDDVAAGRGRLLLPSWCGLAAGGGRLLRWLPAGGQQQCRAGQTVQREPKYARVHGRCPFR